jgi:hypothetical protein
MANIINFPYESSKTFLSLNVAGCYKVLVDSSNTDQINLYYNVPSGASTATWEVTLDWNGAVVSQEDITALSALVRSVKTTPAASVVFTLISDKDAKLDSAGPFAIATATQP